MRRGQSSLWGTGTSLLCVIYHLTRDGRSSTYDVSVLEKMGGGGRCAETGHTLKLPSLTNLAQLGHFPPASQGGAPCRPCVLCAYMSFFWSSYPFLSEGEPGRDLESVILNDSATSSGRGVMDLVGEGSRLSSSYPGPFTRWFSAESQQSKIN